MNLRINRNADQRTHKKDQVNRSTERHGHGIGKGRKIALSVKLNIALVLSFCLLVAWGIYLMRDKLLRNAYEMGNQLAQSYADEEENRISMYQLMMNLGAVYINEKIDGGADRQEIQEWMAQYSVNISSALRASIIDPFAVIDGRIIAAVPWAGDDDYAYADTEWYQNALEADGNIIFTNAYQDVITKKQLVTMAVKLNERGDVLAFDILLENFHAHKNKASMPDHSSYFLFDGTGKLIYLSSEMEGESEGAQEYINQLVSRIAEGSMDSHEASIRDMNGVNRAVYYYAMDNGWISVITIPVQNILQDGWDRAVVFLLLICAGLTLTMAVAMVRSYLGERKMKHTYDTLQILGDTFYAIYRVNYELGTYETVKSSADVREALGEEGEYSYLLQVMKDYVDEKTYEEFEQSFSLENIRSLVDKKIYEYGGDYRRRFGGEFKWVSIKIIHNQALNLNEVIMCFREIDMEKRKQIQQHVLLENALASARQTAQKKNAFFSNVSHDMRTPLNAIIGLAELARKNEGDTERMMDYLEKIQQAGEQMLTLVNDILDMARIERGEGSAMDYAPVNLKKCVEDCAALFEPQIAREGKYLRVLDDVEYPVAYCDMFRMNQILNNLVSNAVKYSMRGAVITVELRITARQEKKCKYQIVVSDTGIGMSPEFLEKIFEPFSREMVFSPSKVSGTGLGMPIVKSLVQQMSGEIAVQSQLGKGSTFTVTLPLLIAEEGALKEMSAEEEAVEEISLEGKQILVAEDNAINMEIVTETLTMMGAEVIQAWNGREAAEIFASTEPGTVDVILMDMQMPEMDGCTSCRKIREMNRSDAGTVPIIAVTANAFAEDIARTTEAGMNGHIAKPIDFRILTEMLGRVMKEERTRK